MLNAIYIVKSLKTYYDLRMLVPLSSHCCCCCLCDPREMCLRYAQLETKLGEIDRARGVFSHGSQISDPRTAKSYWKAWQEFEVSHGNEDTFREMLRIKRSVQAKFNTQVRWDGCCD